MEHVVKGRKHLERASGAEMPRWQGWGTGSRRGGDRDSRKDLVASTGSGVSLAVLKSRLCHSELAP